MYIKLMPEYECYPLWCYEDNSLVNISPESLHISDTLKNDLAKWSGIYESTYIRGNPIESGFKDESEQLRFIEEGRVLGSRLQKELGASHKVSFQV